MARSRGLGFRYAIRNVLHYRAKYATAFVLVAAFAACLSLCLFAFNGFWKQSAAFARSWGDITFWVNTERLDSRWKSSPGDEVPPSKRLEREATDFFLKELQADRVVSTFFVWGQAYGPGGTWSLNVTSLDKARLLAPVELADGAYPGEGEVLLPASTRSSLKVGDGVTFVYKNSDLILNSLRFRVSGFFLPTSNNDRFIYAPEADFARLDEGRASDEFFVFLREARGDRLLSRAEYDRVNIKFRRFLSEMKGANGSDSSGYYTASQRHEQNKTLLDFFELIASLFLVTLVIVAIATIVNVLFITVLDRIRVIGTFMAYGMTRRRAVLLLSSEMLAFSFVACALGVLVAFAAIVPVSSLRFTADNWTIAVILGGKRGLTIIPALWAVGATFLVGMLLPFLAATAAVGRMVKGEVVRLLHYTK
jgi:ABC-type lipoprotein release transport system permease subunit